MEIAVKNIISPYIKIAPDQITVHTTIDRTAVNSSIMLHRMYAHLAKEGFSVSDYWDIKSFGMLLQKLSGILAVSSNIVLEQSSALNNASVDAEIAGTAIGIDIEQISLMPAAIDFREDAFYIMNFAPAEIAYCILQPNPVASLTGLFAAKEAIVKTDNHFLNQPFHSLVIDHLPNGKPVHPQFSLSISHTAGYAVAVAVLKTPIAVPPLPSNEKGNLMPFQNFKLLYFVAFSAFFLSLLLLILFILK